MVKRIAIFTLFAVLISCFMFVAPSCAAPETEVENFSNTLIKSFHDRFKALESTIINAALGLFAGLFLCQFAWSVIQLFLQESLTFAAVVTTIIRQVMTGGFFYWILVDRTILKSIIESFSQLAKQGMDVSTLLFIADVTVERLMQKCGQSTGVLSGFALFLVGLAASLVLLYAMATAVSYIAIVMLENYIVSFLGLILLGFGGSEYTRNYALSYIKTLFHIGFKLFLATIMVTVSITVMFNLVNSIDTGTNESIMQGCLQLIACSFLLLAIIKVIPQISDTLIAGVSMGIGQGSAAIRSGVGVGAALTGGLAMGVGRGAAGTIGTAGSATGAAANAYHASRQSGKSVGRAVGSAFGSALGHSILGVGATAQNVFRGVRNNLADHGILRGHGPQADTIGAAKRQGAGVWSRHKELRAVDEMKQQNSMSAPGAGATGDTPAQAASGTQRGGSRQDFAGIENVSRTGKEALKAPTAEELSKRLGVGGDVNHA